MFKKNLWVVVAVLVIGPVAHTQNGPDVAVALSIAPNTQGTLEGAGDFTITYGRLLSSSARLSHESFATTDAFGSGSATYLGRRWRMQLEPVRVSVTNAVPESRLDLEWLRILVSPTVIADLENLESFGFDTGEPTISLWYKTERIVRVNPSVDLLIVLDVSNVSFSVGGYFTPYNLEEQISGQAFTVDQPAGSTFRIEERGFSRGADSTLSPRAGELGVSMNATWDESIGHSLSIVPGGSIDTVYTRTDTEVGVSVRFPSFATGSNSVLGIAWVYTSFDPIEIIDVQGFESSRFRVVASVGIGA